MTANPHRGDSPIGGSPYDENYGIPDTARLRVARDALLRSAAAAAETSGFGRSSIYKWISDSRRAGLLDNPER